MGLPRPERPLRLLLRVYMENDPGHLAPVCIFGSRVEQTDIGEQPHFVVAGQDGSRRGDIGNIGIKEGLKQVILFLLGTPSLPQLSANTYYS